MINDISMLLPSFYIIFYEMPFFESDSQNFNIIFKTTKSYDRMNKNMFLILFMYGHASYSNLLGNL